MKPETYQRAKQIRIDLEKLNNIETRLSCGSGYFRLEFHGDENKTMNKVFMLINDVEILKLFHKHILSKIDNLEKEFEQL